MALPNNSLQQVVTYQDGKLAYLQNYGCFVNQSNTRFKDFEKLTGNLGSSVSFDKPPRYVTTNGLIAQFQPSTQLVETLTVNQSTNTSYAFDTQQFVYNVSDYMEKFGRSAVAELGTMIEANIALNAVSGVVDSNGQKQTNSGPFRFYNTPNTSLNSFGQLAQMLANFRNFGCPKSDLKVFLPDTVVPQIVNTGLNQFVMNRNDKMANSWEVGDWSGVKFYQSNLLPLQVAGTVGNASTTLTLVSTNDPTGANITQLTFSGATANDVNAIKSGDMAYFLDGVSGQPNMRFLTWIGHVVSSQQVQFRATGDVIADNSGNVVVNIYPALCSQGANANQNLNNALQAGMQVKFIGDHRAGLIVSGDALFLGMPRLPDQPPFPTSNKSDPDTGVSVRLTYGTLFGQNQQGFILDSIWGSHLVPEYSMRIIFPVNQ